MKQKVLITGGSGLLATNWALSIRDNYLVTLILHNRNISISGVVSEFALLGSKEDCYLVLSKYKPDIVINTAGLTDIDQCEKNINLANKVNIELAQNIAIACNELNIKLVHISTDHLFSGENGMTSEDNDINPVNNYAITKAQGELKVQESCKDALIIRTNFFGCGPRYRQSFSDFILNNLKKNKTIELFQDIFFTPILINDLSDKVHQLININSIGIFNVVGDERLSKYEFGIRVARCFKLDTDLISAINTKDRRQLTKRPKDMSLSNRKLCRVLQCKLPTLDAQLQMLKHQEREKTMEQVVLSIIPYGRHYIDDDDVQAVSNVLKYGALTQGPKVVEFENKVANYVGAQYAVAVSNGTAALHLACIALGLSNGDEVITSPNTFIATSNAILYVGAKPVFIDINSQTLNINIEAIEKVIANSKNIKAIFPVHFSGLPCDMEKIKLLGDKYNLAIVEDAAHAFGSIYNNSSKVGNCKYSDMTIFSFHPVKGVSAGEGGIITTNDRGLYRKLFALRSHGIIKGNFEFPGISLLDDSLVNKQDAIENGELKRWYYEMQYLGYNYRITDIQSALAISQMNKINLFLDRRREISKRYDEAFKLHANIRSLQVHGRNQSSNHIYIVSIDFKKIGLSRHQFMKNLAHQGVGSQVHYIPVIRQPYYQNLGYKYDDFPLVEKYYQTALSIPLYYGLSDTDQEFVISSIKSLLQ
jgi:UDP-4-amino-4,6-dideoxy-N-acetyl-beta-L-altrosamine transaminase/dTDP-4-dehydrorhamnose reductase